MTMYLHKQMPFVKDPNCIMNVRKKLAVLMGHSISTQEMTYSASKFAQNIESSHDNFMEKKLLMLLPMLEEFIYYRDINTH